MQVLEDGRVLREPSATVHALLRARRAAARRFLPEILCLPLLALIVALPPLVRGQLIGRGEIAHQYSMYAFVSRAIRASHLPLWNPYTVAGNPGLADPLAQVFYPLTVPLLTVLSTAATLNTMIIVHVAMAGAFMHLYLGSLRLSRPPRFVGSVAYMLSGFVAWRILSGDLPRLATYAWIPLLFYLVEEIACGRRGMWAALLGGASAAVQFFAGDPQTFVYSTLALLAYAGARVAAVAHNRASRPHVRRAALAIAAMLILGTGLAGVQALPTAEAFFLSNRTAFGADFASLGSVHPAGLVSLIAPRFFGDEIHGWWGEVELQAREFYPHAASFYSGFFILTMAIAALLTRRDRWHVQFFAVLAVAVLWAALGKFGYVYRAVAYVPILRSFRDIENINVLVPMSTSVLAAIGFERYLEPGAPASTWNRVRSGVALAVGAGVALIAVTILAERRLGLDLLSLPFVRHTVLESALFVLIVWGCSASLLRARAKYDAAPAWLTAAALVFLLADLLYSSAPLIAEGTDFSPMTHADAVTRYFAQDTSVYRVSGFYDRGPSFGVQDIEGEPSLLLARYQHYTDALHGYDLKGRARFEGPHGVAIRAHFESPLLDLLNVKYSALTPVDLRAADLRTARRRDPSLFVQVAPDTVIYRRPHVLPRVLTVTSYLVVHDPSVILGELRRPAFDPRTVVMLEEEPRLPPGFDTAAVAAGAPGRVNVVSYEDNQVVVKADLARAGFVLLNDIYYPAWQAEIDGRPVPVYRANYLFRAVAVPAGSHEVRFVYRDRMLALGAGIALVTAICGIAAGVVDRRRRIVLD